MPTRALKVPEGPAALERPLIALTTASLALIARSYRESTRWVVGGIPSGGLVPGENYWVLAQAGIIGDLVGDSPGTKRHLGRVKYFGAVRRRGDRNLNIRDFAVSSSAGKSGQAVLLYVVLGTSAEVGKTTAANGIIRSLLQSAHTTIVTLKATGTSSISELLAYRDFGAAHVFDCVDFGLPTTYPSDRADVEGIFNQALDVCLRMPADALIIECGGDFLGANVQPMATPQLAAADVPPNSAAEIQVGPFEWVPSEVGHECMFMVVSAAGDPSNTDNFAAGESIEEWRLVPNDNNIGQRNVVPVMSATSKKLLAGFDRMGFLLKNPFRKRARMSVSAELPAFLAEHNWRIAFTNAGRCIRA
jgi:hypothetical protein